MRQKSGKKGFAMLEVMIIIMIFMVLAASLFASAGALNRRAVKRATNNEAYYAALAAVKLMAGEVMNDEQGQAAVALTGFSGLPEQLTAISIATADGETRSVPVKISSILHPGGQFLTLMANATVAGQTENISMTLQKRNSYVPDYPYGCGVMGQLSLKPGSEIITGPDVDLYLQGYLGMNDSDIQSGRIAVVGGNLISDHTPLNLKEVGIGGMIISNDDVALERCVVGNTDTVRRGGVYTTGFLSLTNCDIYGDVYTGKFSANGKEDINGSLNYREWVRNNYTVWSATGEAVNTTKDEYRRSGEVNATKGQKKILDSSVLKDYVPKAEDVFVPQAEATTEDREMKVIRVSGTELLSDLMAGIEHGADVPVKTVIFVEENASLITLENEEYNVFIYGKGTMNLKGTTVIYGGIQAKKIELATNSKLEVYHGEPADPAFNTPSSSVGFHTWSPLDYNMDPTMED